MKYKILLIVLVFLQIITAQVTTVMNGNWSNPAVWSGGVVPNNVDVIIGDEHRIYVDTSFSVNNLTITGILLVDTLDSYNMIVNNNLTVDTGGYFEPALLEPSDKVLLQSLTIYEDIINNGNFDMRKGILPAVHAIQITITGTNNTEILAGENTALNNDFNGVTIAKTPPAKVILLSNVAQNNNSFTAPARLFLNSGIIETGNFYWEYRATSIAANISGGSNTSYINGNLVRWMAGSNGITLNFPIGDDQNYRPLQLFFPSSVTNSKLMARVTNGNANQPTSTFLGGIDLVSKNRYFVVSNIDTSAKLISDFSLSYGLDDGVAPGNRALKTAVSLDNMLTWTNRGPDSLSNQQHVTNLTNPPTIIRSDTLGVMTLDTGAVMYLSLANLTGRFENELPVELTSFDYNVSGLNVNLTWKTATETNNKGFSIERKSLDNGFSEIAFVSGAGTSTEINSYSFVDKLNSAGTYTYRLKQMDLNGDYSYSKEIEVSALVPNELSLLKNYPNPFNPTTTIEFSVPEKGLAKIKVFAITGEEVATLFNEVAEPGQMYKVTFNASKLASGLYLAKLEFNGSFKINKMILAK